MTAARSAAVVTWVYAAGFGIPAVPVAIYVVRRGYLPWFVRLFPMYGVLVGPLSRSLRRDAGRVLRVDDRCLVRSLAGMARSRTGAVVALALLPVEAVFWIGFALPFPWPIGIARAALLVSAAASAGIAARRRGLRHRLGWRGIRLGGPGGSRSR